MNKSPLITRAQTRIDVSHIEVMTDEGVDDGWQKSGTDARMPTSGITISACNLSAAGIAENSICCFLSAERQTFLLFSSSRSKSFTSLPGI